MDQTQQMMRFAMRCVAVLVIPLTAKFEAGVHVYWLTSNGLAVLQASTLARGGAGDLERGSRRVERVEVGRGVAPSLRGLGGERRARGFAFSPARRPLLQSPLNLPPPRPAFPPALPPHSTPSFAVQTLALRQPAIRNAVGMPPAPSRSAADTPADSVMKSLFSGLPASLTGGAATAPVTEAARPILIPKVLLDAPPDHAAGSGKHGGGKGGGRQTGKNKKGGR